MPASTKASNATDACHQLDRRELLVSSYERPQILRTGARLGRVVTATSDLVGYVYLYLRAHHFHVAYALGNG